MKKLFSLPMRKGQDLSGINKIAVSAVDQRIGERIRSAKTEIERRLHDRHLTIFRVAKLTMGDDESICVARNLSPGGMMIEVLEQLDPGQQVCVSLAPGRQLEGSVIWQRDSIAGVQFEAEIDMIDVLTRSGVEPGGRTWRMPRISVRVHAQLRVRSIALPIEICDISPRGARIKAEYSFDEHEMVWIVVKGLDPICGTLRWRLDGKAGIEFASIIPVTRFMQWLRANVAIIAPNHENRALAIPPDESSD